jgi:hypothetical protein
MRSALTDMAQTGIAISMVDLAAGLVLATLLGLVAVLVYRRTHRGMHYERSFMVTLVMLPPIVAVVMMMIGSNLALSLGMVGALSIIRFRTVIKDSRDMVFLFFAIAIGLGCGTYNWTVTTVAALFLSAMLVVLYFLQFGASLRADYALVLSGNGPRPGAALRDALGRHVEVSGLRSINIEDGRWEMVFEVRSLDGDPLVKDDLFRSLETDHGVQRISLLAPQLTLPI